MTKKKVTEETEEEAEVGERDPINDDLETTRVAVLDILTEAGHGEGSLAVAIREALTIANLRTAVESASNPDTPFGTLLRDAAGVK